MKLRIQERFGYTPQQIREMSYPDYLELVAYVQKEPDDAILRAKYHADLYAYHLNSNRDTKKCPEPISADAVYPWATYTIPDQYISNEELLRRKKEKNEQEIQKLRTALGH